MPDFYKKESCPTPDRPINVSGTRECGTLYEMQRRYQSFQNSTLQCFQQLQGLPWDCQTPENTGKTAKSWVIAVGDSSQTTCYFRSRATTH